MMFCGEAIGEAAPPIFEASAIPSMSAFEKLESAGRFRSSGYQDISLSRNKDGAVETVPV